MKPIYEWLFDRYALPKLRSIENDHNAAIIAFAERASLTRIERLRLQDMVSNMCLEWDAEAFALGIRFGLRLNAPRLRSREPGWLLDFLP